MKIKNNDGYTLVEILIVLSITSSILIFFTNSFLNNFRFINKYQRTSQTFIKFQVLNMIERDLEKAFSVVLNENLLELEIPFFEDENHFCIHRVGYQIITNKLIRKEIGEREKSKMLDLGDLSMNFELEMVSNLMKGRMKLTIIYSDTNGQIDSYYLNVPGNRGLK